MKLAINIWKLKTVSLRRLGLVIALLSFAQACFYPEAPSRITVERIQLRSDRTSEWDIMATHYKTVQPSGPRKGPALHRKVKRHKNLLFVVADDFVQKNLQPELQRIYKTDDIRLEEVLWWFYAPIMKKTYNYVLRLHWDGLNADSLKKALKEMEAQKQPYDVMLLAHGIPNNLIASPGQGLISWRHIGALKNSLRYADALYLQACFGNTLAPDFKAAGFKHVIAYEKLNWNFFYPEYYLEALSKTDGDTKAAHEYVLKHFNFDFSTNLVHQEIMKRFFNETRKGYLENVQLPEIY